MRVRQTRMPVFIMTVDVDSWSSLLNYYSVNHDSMTVDKQVNIEEGLGKLLQLFDEHDIKATFFVPGEVARRHESAIRRIQQKGHEVACHGLTHEKNEFLKELYEQERNLREATWIIEKAVGHRPLGFRAPCLRSNYLTIQILKKLGYVYDSSVVPTYVPSYYGSLFAPKKPYCIYSRLMPGESFGKIIEIPVSVNPLLPLPLSAAWMRNLGLSWVKFGTKINFIFCYPVTFYVHPRDVSSLPRVKGVPWHLYRNSGNSGLKMLDKIIEYAKKQGAKFMRAIDFVNSIIDGIDLIDD